VNSNYATSPRETGKQTPTPFIFDLINSPHSHLTKEIPNFDLVLPVTALPRFIQLIPTSIPWPPPHHSKTNLNFNLNFKPNIQFTFTTPNHPTYSHIHLQKHPQKHHHTTTLPPYYTQSTTQTYPPWQPVPHPHGPPPKPYAPTNSLD
jgi:hypothetical protein